MWDSCCMLSSAGHPLLPHYTCIFPHMLTQHINVRQLLYVIIGGSPAVPSINLLLPSHVDTTHKCEIAAVCYHRRVTRCCHITRVSSLTCWHNTEMWDSCCMLSSAGHPLLPQYTCIFPYMLTPHKCEIAAVCYHQRVTRCCHNKLVSSRTCWHNT